ncbi:hypothetical protein BJY04DRAFT_216327 [Aspergillus karnatakaensis]|uniref:uncharacterized protein n=1 Tax=Aspergillus karnatakaensis TaxID=1810916 RepID=UPI003CCE19F1
MEANANTSNASNARNARNASNTANTTNQRETTNIPDEQTYIFHLPSQPPKLPLSGLLGIEELSVNGWIYATHGSVRADREPLTLPRVIWVNPDTDVQNHFEAASWVSPPPWTAMTAWKLTQMCLKSESGVVPKVGDKAEGLWAHGIQGFLLCGRGTVVKVWDDITVYWVSRYGGAVQPGVRF